jgi:hypothetical protein
MCLLNRCFSELNAVATDMLYGYHLIYLGEFEEIWDSIAWWELHNIISGRVWALVRANLSFRLQTKLALHHNSYPVGKLFSIHTSKFLSQLSLSLNLRSLYLHLLILSRRLLELLCIITIRVLIPRMWHKLICAGIRNQVVSLWIVDLGIVSCVSLQSTIEVVGINTPNDPLHWWSNSLGRLRHLIGSTKSFLSWLLHNLLRAGEVGCWTICGYEHSMIAVLVAAPCHLSLPPSSR